MATQFSEKELKFLKGKRVMICTPCYGGMVSTYYLQSFINLIQTCEKYQVHYILSAVANESLITRARNSLVDQFLNYKDEGGHYDYLMFIDADIQFEGDSVMRLIAHDKDIVTGAYPMKIINFNSIENISETADKLATRVTEYVVNIKFENEEQRSRGEVKLKDGLIELLDAGTGFMLIKRSVFEKIKEYYPDIAYSNDAHTIKPDGTTEIVKTTVHAFFDTMIDDVDKRYLSEDYAFCRRWQKIGGKVYLDPAIILNHVGNYVFHGKPLIKG